MAQMRVGRRFYFPGGHELIWNDDKEKPEIWVRSTANWKRYSTSGHYDFTVLKHLYEYTYVSSKGEFWDGKNWKKVKEDRVPLVKRNISNSISSLRKSVGLTKEIDAEQGFFILLVKDFMGRHHVHKLNYEKDRIKEVEYVHFDDSIILNPDLQIMKKLDLLDVSLNNLIDLKEDYRKSTMDLMKSKEEKDHMVLMNKREVLILENTGLKKEHDLFIQLTDALKLLNKSMEEAMHLKRNESELYDKLIDTQKNLNEHLERSIRLGKENIKLGHSSIRLLEQHNAYLLSCFLRNILDIILASGNLGLLEDDEVSQDISFDLSKSIENGHSRECYQTGDVLSFLLDDARLSFPDGILKIRYNNHNYILNELSGSLRKCKLLESLLLSPEYIITDWLREDIIYFLMEIHRILHFDLYEAESDFVNNYNQLLDLETETILHYSQIHGRRNLFKKRCSDFT